MIVFRQNQPSAAQRELLILMVNDADGFTPGTGLTVAVQIVKAGQIAYANIAGTVTEVGHWTYKMRLTSAKVPTALRFDGNRRGHRQNLPRTPRGRWRVPLPDNPSPLS